MIRAICCKCGKDLKMMLPDDAEEITCFACCEKLQRWPGTRSASTSHAALDKDAEK